jgi:hypothetical protein
MRYSAAKGEARINTFREVEQNDRRKGKYILAISERGSEKKQGGFEGSLEKRKESLKEREKS